MTLPLATAASALAAIGVRASTVATHLLQGTKGRWCLFWLGVLVNCSLPDTDAAQEFSADLVGTGLAGGATQTTGKIYVSESKVRLETSDFPEGLFLLDGSIHTAYFVKPTQRVVMDAKQSTWLTQILVPLDADHPCKQWQAMAEIAGAADEGRRWQCDRVGFESLGGRKMIRYRAISPLGAAGDCWIDPQLGFVMSVHRDDGAAIDVENIQQASPPTALFGIPADFRRFDPHQLIDRIKHSDVWVEPPK